MVRPSGDHIGCRASPKTSVIRVMAPPDAGIVQMLPCMSVAMVLPSGEIATDIEVPSRTVTSMVFGADGFGAGFWVPAVARRGACPPTLPKAAPARSRRSSPKDTRAEADAAREVNPATAPTNNEISAARFMKRAEIGRAHV